MLFNLYKYFVTMIKLGVTYVCSDSNYSSRCDINITTLLSSELYINSYPKFGFLNWSESKNAIVLNVDF